MALEADVERRHCGQRQPRTDRPGAVQHRRQRHQIFGRTRAASPRVTRGARATAARDPAVGRRQRPGHSRRRPTAQRATERFVRLEKSRSQPGSGLGLSLAKAVMTFHGGRLELVGRQSRPYPSSMSLSRRKAEPLMARASRGSAAKPTGFCSRAASRGRCAARPQRGRRRPAPRSPQRPPRRSCRGLPRCSPTGGPARGFPRRRLRPVAVPARLPPAAGRQCSTSCSTPTVEARLAAISAAIARLAFADARHGSRADDGAAHAARRRRIS